MKQDTAAAASSRRRLLVRCALVAAFVGLGALVFVLGKGHTLILDNKDVGDVAAIDGLTISVDGREPVEYMSGDRDMEKVVGQRHRIAVETYDGVKVERSIRLPVGQDMLLLSIPMLVAGKEPMLSRFVARDQAPPPDADVGNTNQYTAPGGDAPAAAPEGAPVAPPVE